MPSTYTVNLGIEKPATGEQSGTWGDTTNVNFDIVDQAINGVLSLTLASAGTSGSPNTLTIDNGATSDGRNKWIEFVDGGDLGANAYVQLDPNDAEKIVFFRNSLSGSRSVFVFQGTYNAANDFEIPAGYDVVLKFDGGGASATVTDVFQKLRVTELYTPTLGAGTADINDGTVEAVIGGTTPKAGTFTTLTANTNLTVNASTTVDGIIDDDTMATASATKLSTSESIKAYVDSQVGTVDTLSEILANGNTSGANNLIIDNGQAITTNTVNETTAGSGVTVDSVLLKDDGINATNLEITNIKANDGTAAGSIANSTGAVTITSFISNSVDIGGGAIDGTTIGGTTPNSGAFTTLSATGDLTVDTNTLYVDSTNNRIGVGTSSPAAKLHSFVSSSGAAAVGGVNLAGFFEAATVASIQLSSGTGSSAYLFMGDAADVDAFRLQAGDGFTQISASGASDYMRFDTGGFTERMRISSAGNVGIGTSSPSAKLTVNGDSEINSLTIGRGAGNNINNTAVGYHALLNNSTAANNTAVGVNALLNNTTGGYNTAVGNSPLLSNTTASFNTAVGNGALLSNTTGGQNTAVGNAALQNNTTAVNNTAVGLNALLNNTTASNNTAVGTGALVTNTTGASNTATGREALRNNTTGGNNIAVGYQSLYSNTTGANNTAVGFLSLYSNTTGTQNNATGREALYNNTTGNYNDSVGYQSLYSNTTGASNTAAGNQSLYSNTTGTANIAVGYRSLYSNTTGNYNNATGREALSNNTTGGQNTTTGYQSLSNNTTGAANTVCGFLAGDIITTGNRNVIIGGQSDPSAEDGNDQIVVGYSLTGKGNDTAYVGGINGAYNEKNVTTWETTSDERIKKNIKDNNAGLDILSQIQVRNFEYRTPDEITNLPSHAAIEKDGVQLGVIAQEIQKVLPECVSENSTGVLSVNTDPLVWYLINAVKELKAEIQALKGN
jgi:hypothetical protein